jgi:exopolysaccharide production protein ExoQ
MANEALAVRAIRPWIDQAALLGFLALAFVGLSPFSPPPPDTIAGGMTGTGDLARQVCYLIVLAAILAGAYRMRGIDALSALPVVLVVLLAWCGLSAMWSAEPGITVRRAGLAAVLVVSAMLSVEVVGAARTLVLWRWLLLAVLLVNLLSIHFIPQAVHLVGESDPQLVGDWRGLYGHKNIAGSVGAMTAIIFLMSPSRTILRKAFDVAVAAAAAFFTAMTHSKSSLGILVVAIVAGGIYRLAWRKDIDRVMAVVAGAVLATAALAFAIADQNAVMRLFEDPEQFTGRTEIWKGEIAYILDHPLLGAGFGTFSGTGGVSPLHDYVTGWVAEARHGHNGYLQLLVTTGAIGFALAFAALIVSPAVAFWERRGEIATKALLFALFVFLVLHNLMETDFLEGDGVTWVAYLMMLAMLYQLRREAGP